MQKINSRTWFPVAVFSLLAILAACSGMGIKLDPESETFYEYARLIMTDDETNIFKHLADKEERARFIQDFWDKRDPDPQTDANEFQEEFYYRISYANQRFRQGPPGWKTDRGRIFIYFGAPDKTEEWHPMQTQEEANAGVSVQSRIRGILRWTYYRYGLAIDIGTTTVVAQLLDMNSGKLLGSEGCHNQQASYGEDVISRMIFACGNAFSKNPIHLKLVGSLSVTNGSAFPKADISLKY